MAKRQETPDLHPLAGKFDMSGKLILPNDGGVFSFKAATIKRNPKGPQVKEFVACTLDVLLNEKAYAQILEAQEANQEPAEA